MDVRRVALIFDHKTRPEATGVYCRRALGGLVEVEHFLPSETATIPRGQFDLYLNIDDGLEYRLPSDLHPRAWWAIDTHLNFDWCLEKARDFDAVFAAQRDGAERLKAEGIASAVWLPLGCDAEFHRGHDVAKRFDVAFVGNIVPGPLKELLKLIRERFPDTFVGNASFEEMARTYSATRIAFNRSIKNDVNTRVFEAMACGSLLLTNDLQENGQNELFQDGVHLATYRDADELVDKILYYLRHDEIRERIAAQGAREARSKHTYAARMKTLLAKVETEQSKVAVAVPNRLRDDSYYGHARPELLALIPPSARAVLDLGCGSGRLGEAVKARQEAHVTGVEMDGHAAGIARTRLDRVVVGDIESGIVGFEPNSFNAIVCGDILEHLREPGCLLRKAREWLKPDGRLIASIPNVRHHSVIRSLLEGNWTYESAGLLDRDHLRFFTRREIEKMFFRAGFEVTELGYVVGPGDEDPAKDQRATSIRIGNLNINGLSEGDIQEFHAYQYLITARPKPKPEYGLTSIVILTHNQLPYTRECLDSIRHLTDEPYELILVDNGSSDGTPDYLRSLPGVRLIANAENRGFPAAANQGILAAKGDQVLLLNNDTIVTTGWLDRLLRCLHADPKIGLVGPCSNQVSGIQQVSVNYDTIGGLDGFAWDWGKRHHGFMEDSDRLIGFCLLMRRTLIDTIGLLDERFGLGCFEDDDYCRRALQAGFRAVVARDAFVHHYGGRTFVGSGVDFAAVMRENERRFRDKWAADLTKPQATVTSPPSGIDPAVLKTTIPPGTYVAKATKHGGLLLQRKHVRLSLCMIVRDSSRTLIPCLESIYPWVDELVIVDTGSIDETPDIVERFGGRLFHFPWCDDFSAARNESLRHARGEWLFWMDSDDTITPECGRHLRRLAYGESDPSILGFVAQVHCPGGGEDGAYDVTAVDHVKLIRNRPDLRFDGRIHEQILPAIRQAGGKVAWSDIHVVHSGSEHTLEAQERKRRRDLRILRLELAERPDHPFTLFNLGMTYADGARYEEAVEYLRRGIGQSGPEESHLRKAYALLVYAQMQLNRLDEAGQTCREGLGLFPDDIELRFRQGVLLHELGRLGEAARAYWDVLGNQEERHFSSVDQGLKGFKARQNLAIVYTDMNDFAEAENQWRAIVQEVPQYRPGWRGLGDALLRQGKIAEVETLAGNLHEKPSLRIEGLLLAGKAAEFRGEFEEAGRAFARAVAESPENVETRHVLCQFLFEHGVSNDAERALKELLLVAPQDPSAHHNLGLLYMRSQRYKEAVNAFRESLHHRSNSATTYLNLGYALKESGRIQDAVEAWKDVLRHAPNDPAAMEELRRAGQRRVLT